MQVAHELMHMMCYAEYNIAHTHTSKELKNVTSFRNIRFSNGVSIGQGFLICK